MATKLDEFKGIHLKEHEKQDIWDTFKVSGADQNLPLNQRKVNVKDLVGTKLERKSKRIDQLI